MVGEDMYLVPPDETAELFRCPHEGEAFLFRDGIITFQRTLKAACER
jgi:hypothetical protein